MDDPIDIFDADGALTREFLLDRGYCCQNGCRNCPYGFKKPVDGDRTSTTPHDTASIKAVDSKD